MCSHRHMNPQSKMISDVAIFFLESKNHGGDILRTNWLLNVMVELDALEGKPECPFHEYSLLHAGGKHVRWLEASAMRLPFVTEWAAEDTTYIMLPQGVIERDEETELQAQLLRHR